MVVLFLLPFKISGQDISAAYIRCSSVQTSTSAYKYTYTVVVASEATSAPRPSINQHYFVETNQVQFSLNTSELKNGVIVTTYTGSFTHTGPGYAPSWVLDTFRIANVRNIENSNKQPIYVFCRQYIDNITRINESIKVYNFPPQLTLVGDRVYYDPQVKDPDSDSLSFHLLSCFTESTSSYYIPGNVTFSSSNGEISLSADSIGFYAFCVEIREWKKGTTGIYQVAHSTLFDYVLDVSATVGLLEDGSCKEVTVFPNPSIDRVYLQIDSCFSEAPTDFIIYDLKAEVVLSGRFPSADNNMIEISGLTPGLYFIRITMGDEYHIEKFAKLPG